MIRDIMGETIPDHIVTQTVIANGFDSEKSLDALLQINTKPPPCKFIEVITIGVMDTKLEQTLVFH